MSLLRRCFTTVPTVAEQGLATAEVTSPLVGPEYLAYTTDGLEFMNDHQAIAPRLLAGFRATEKLYGSSPQRLNQACLISFFSG
jgi:hypothetical protein